MGTRARRPRVAALSKKVLGLAALRPGQQGVIDSVLARQHTLAIVSRTRTRSGVSATG
jgi:superfamily II DNA helicase RecQ